MSADDQRIFLIDTDAGLDDAQAIFIALSQRNINVVGITTCHGNTRVEHVTKNVLRILNVANQLSVPVYSGAAKSLLGTSCPDVLYHGADGLGDTPDENPPDDDLIDTKVAAVAIMDIAKQHKGQLELICLGPLTNVALALRLEPRLGEYLKHCYVMGGSPHGQGNITLAAEFNFYADAEAAKCVLEEIGCDVTLVGWEMCKAMAASWDEYNNLRTIPSIASQFLRHVERKVMKSREVRGRLYVPADEVLMLCALNSDLVTKSKHVFSTVNTDGEILRGQSIVDWHGKLKKEPNCVLILEVDKQKYWKELRNAMS